MFLTKNNPDLKAKIQDWEQNVVDIIRRPGMAEEITIAIAAESSLGTFFRRDRSNSCGTPSCLAGHMVIMPEFSSVLTIVSEPEVRGMTYYVCWPRSVAGQEFTRIYTDSYVGENLFNSYGSGFERKSYGEFSSLLAKLDIDTVSDKTIVCVIFRLACTLVMDISDMRCRSSRIDTATLAKIMEEFDRLYHVRKCFDEGVNI